MQGMHSKHELLQLRKNLSSSKITIISILRVPTDQVKL